MGNLVDNYILCPKYDVDAKGLRDNYIDRREGEILEMVDDETDKAFLADVFSQNFQLLDLFMPALQMPDVLWKIIEAYEESHPHWRFARRYREDSLLQRFRKRFFKTLLIIVDDYDPNKENRFIIVRSDDCIVIEPKPEFVTMSEEQFASSTD